MCNRKVYSKHNVRKTKFIKKFSFYNGFSNKKLPRAVRQHRINSLLLFIYIYIYRNTRLALISSSLLFPPFHLTFTRGLFLHTGGLRSVNKVMTAHCVPTASGTASQRSGVLLYTRSCFYGHLKETSLTLFSLDSCLVPK